MSTERVSDVCPEQAAQQPSANVKRKRGKRRKGRRKAVPQRTCVGCRTTQSKRDMLRVVRTPEGAVEIDPSGKRSGRGAYLCQQSSCWELALKRRSLDHALKITLDETSNAALSTYAQTLPKQRGGLPQEKDLQQSEAMITFNQENGLQDLDGE